MEPVKIDLKKFEGWQKRNLDLVMQRLNIPLRIRPIILQKGIPPIEHLQSFNSMYIHGESGTGKTVLAVQFLLGMMAYRYACGNIISGCFISIPELFLNFRDSFHTADGPSEKTLLDRYDDYDLLVLDDLGVQNTTDWSFQLLYMLINRRYDNMDPMIITSNYSLSELQEQMKDDRIPSRLYEICDVIEQKHQYRHTL